MSIGELVPALAGITLLVGVAIGLLGWRGARNAKRKGLRSALADE